MASSIPAKGVGSNLDMSMRQRSPQDTSLGRLKERSHSRNARLEEKLMSTSGSKIQRQSSAQLKSLGAYR